MNLYHLLAVVVLLSAVFSYVNHKFIKWPQTIGIMALSLLSSIVILALGPFVPELRTFGDHIASLDFNTVIIKGMLGLLLFAGSFHLDAHALKKQLLTVFTLASLSTVLSTFMVAAMAYAAFHVFGVSMPFIYCLLFGALISPTDPIAVMGILKERKIGHSLEIKIAGESLFNDGMAVVLFLSIVEMAGGQQEFGMGDAVLLFLREAGGGLLFGFLLGGIGYIALRSIDNYKVEVLITIALVMSGYYFADVLHISGPLAMVTAGIITGNAKDKVMSDTSRDYLVKFWEMVDEILNTILFLLVGLVLLVVKINTPVLIIGFLMIFIVLLARWLSVAFPVLLLRPWVSFEKHVIKILTWGGLRGGLSIAMALSLPAAFHRDEFVAFAYIIAVFSILVQGLTIERLVRSLK